MARRVNAPPTAACKAPKASRKKLAKFERLQRQKERTAVVAAANAVADLLGGLDGPRTFGSPGAVEAHAEAVSGPQLTTAEVDQCLELLASNMRGMYVAAGWGWETQTKRDGLVAADTRVLLLRGPPAAAPAAPPAAVEEEDAEEWVLVDHPPGANKDKPRKPPAQPYTAAKEDAAPARTPMSGELLGFVQLEFCIEADKPVLYVLELQLAAEARNMGLGECPAAA